MTRDDIIRMAREAGFLTGTINGADGQPAYPLVAPIGHGCMVEIERFASLVTAAERKARQDAQIQNEELKARIARVGLEGNLAKAKAVKDEREACAQVALQIGEVMADRYGVAAECITTAEAIEEAIRARGTAPSTTEPDTAS